MGLDVAVGYAYYAGYIGTQAHLSRFSAWEGSESMFRASGILVLAGALVVVACGPASAPQSAGGSGTSGPQGTLRIATSQEPGVLMAGKGTTTAWGFYATQIYDNLYDQAADLSRQPALAVSNTVSSDNLTITFKLRDGVKFQDGTPLTSSDVKFSFDYILDPANSDNRRATLSTVVKSVSAPDASTVTFTMVGPDASYLVDLAQPILPKDYFTKVGWDGFNKAPIGTGPYKVVEYKLHESMTLEANANYWGPPIGVKTIAIRFVPDANTRVALLQTGEVDVIDGVQPQQISDLKNTAGTRVVTVPNNETNAILFNTKSPKDPNPFKNKAVRQALNYAVNKDAIIKNIQLGTVSPEVTVLVSSSPIGHAPELKPYPYDPAKARALLAQAGYANGVPGDWELSFPNGRYVLGSQVLQAVAADLKAVGVTVHVVPNDIAVWGQRMQAQDGTEVFPMSFTQAGNSSGDPYINFRGYLDSRVANSHYMNPQFDAILDKSRSVFDMKARDLLFQDAERLLYDDCPYIYLYEGSNTFGIAKTVQWEPPKGWTFYRFWEMHIQ